MWCLSPSYPGVSWDEACLKVTRRRDHDGMRLTGLTSIR